MPENDEGIRALREAIAGIGSGNIPRVLIVDDDGLDRSLMRRTLANYRLIVDEAESGSAAISKYSITRYDVVFFGCKNARNERR